MIKVKCTNGGLTCLNPFDCK